MHVELWWRALALMLLSGLTASLQAAEFKLALIQFEPWGMKNPDAQSAERSIGVVVDLVHEFERRSGHKVRITLTPYARVEQELESGETDFAIMAWGEARARYANKGNAFKPPLLFGVRFRKGSEVLRYEDLHGLKLCTPRGLRVDPRYDVDPEMQKVMVLDYSTGVRMLAAERDVQGVAGSLSSIDYAAERQGVTQRFGGTLVLNTTDLAVAFSKKSPMRAFEAEVNRVFRGITVDGLDRRIYEKWFFGRNTAQ